MGTNTRLTSPGGAATMIIDTHYQYHQEPAQHSMELLVVEDNPSTQKMLAFLLRNEGYKVHAVSTASNGLYLLRNEAIDLLVLDVMLPDGSGLQVCRQIRSEGLTLPILVISALGRRDDKLAALNEGADDYMT